MSSYLVIVDKAEDVDMVQERLNRRYPGSHQHHGAGQVFFVRAEMSLTECIARDLGMSPDGKSGSGVPGAVFKLSPGYAGFSRPSIWEWMAQGHG